MRSKNSDVKVVSETTVVSAPCPVVEDLSATSKPGGSAQSDGAADPGLEGHTNGTAPGSAPPASPTAKPRAKARRRTTKAGAKKKDASKGRVETDVQSARDPAEFNGANITSLEDIFGTVEHRVERPKENLLTLEPATPEEVNLHEFPYGELTPKPAHRERIVEYARNALSEGDQGYFLAGDAINHIRATPTQRVMKPVYSNRDIAVMLGRWHASFVYKLSLVAAECDAATRAFALKHRLGWHCCFVACMMRRNDGSSDSVITYLTRIATRMSENKKAPQVVRDPSEVAFDRMASHPNRGSFKSRMGKYGLLLYLAAKKWVANKVETPLLEQQWRAEVEYRVGRHHQRAEAIKQNAIRAAARLCDDDESYAHSDFKTLVKFIEAGQPTEHEFDFGLFEGAIAIKRITSRKQETISF